MGWSLPQGARGVWVKIPAIEVVEVLAGAGAGFIVIDREHGAIGLRAMTAMIALARGLSLPVFVRVPSHAPEQVQPALDAGANGLFVPHVDDGEEARRVVDACRFPPGGHRGGSPATRHGDWGSAGLAELVRRGNEEVMLVAQVETPLAVSNIDAIVGVAGIDALFLGPFDLAMSSGLAPASPQFQQLVTSVEQACASRCRLGGVAAGPASARQLAERAYAFVMAGADTTLLGDAARALMQRGTA